MSSQRFPSVNCRCVLSESLGPAVLKRIREQVKIETFRAVYSPDLALSFWAATPFSMPEERLRIARDRVKTALFIAGATRAYYSPINFIRTRS